MKKDDMSFEIEEDGKTYKCDIIGIIPNDKKSEEPYVIFTDYMLDENDDMRKRNGKLVQSEDDYFIELKLSDEEVKYIDDNKDREIIQYVNNTIMESVE